MSELLENLILDNQLNMKKITINLFFLFFFSFGYSQDHYLYYDNFKNEMLIRSFSDKTIGSIRLVPIYNSHRVNYYDIDNKLVKSEKIDRTDLTLKNFMDTKEKNPEITISDKYYNEIGVRFWNKNINQYDLFNLDDEPMGTYKFISGKWEYRETQNFKNSNSYVVLFKPNKSFSSSSNNTSPNSNQSVSSKVSTPKTSSKTYSRSYAYSGILYAGYLVNNQGYAFQMPTSIFEMGYFDYSSNYFGFKFGSKASDTPYQPDDGGSYADQLYAFTYGRAITSHGGFLDALFLKGSLGYNPYNYATVESFGNFYDIGGDFYADIGLKFLIDILYSPIISVEYNIDIKGYQYWGVGIGIVL